VRSEVASDVNRRTVRICGHDRLWCAQSVASQAYRCYNRSSSIVMDDGQKAKGQKLVPSVCVVDESSIPHLDDILR
jgi:hypothetical protein